LGLWCLTRYIQSITRLCSVVDFSGSLAPSSSPSPSSSFSLSSSSSFSPSSSSSFSPSSSSSLSLPSSSSCPLRHPALFVVVILLVWWLWGSIRGRGVCSFARGLVVQWLCCSVSCCRGGHVVGCVVAPVVLSWLDCLGGGCVVVAVFAPSSSSSWLRCRRGCAVVVVALSLWCHGPHYTCVGVGCSSLHPYGAPSSLRHPRLGFCCRSPHRDDLPTPGLNPQVVI